MRVGLCTSKRDFFGRVRGNRAASVLFASVRVRRLSKIRLKGLIQELYPSVCVIFVASCRRCTTRDCQVRTCRCVLGRSLRFHLPKITRRLVRGLRGRGGRFYVVGSNARRIGLLCGSVLCLCGSGNTGCMGCIAAGNIMERQASLRGTLGVLGDERFLLIRHKCTIGVGRVYEMDNSAVCLRGKCRMPMDGTELTRMGQRVGLC